MNLSVKLKCPQCLNNFNNNSHEPIIFQCGHSVCKKCTDGVHNCFTCNKTILTTVPNYAIKTSIGDDGLFRNMQFVCSVCLTAYGDNSDLQPWTNQCGHSFCVMGNRELLGRQTHCG